MKGRRSVGLAGSGGFRGFVRNKSRAKMEFSVFQIVTVTSCPISEQAGEESGSIFFTSLPPPIKLECLRCP